MASEATPSPRRDGDCFIRKERFFAMTAFGGTAKSYHNG